MRLKKSRAAADEDLVGLVNEGYGTIEAIEEGFSAKTAAGVFDPETELAVAAERFGAWCERSVAAIRDIFPTELEARVFCNPEIPFGAVASGLNDYRYRAFRYKLPHIVRCLDGIRSRLNDYTDLPLTARLYAEDIDSFAKVRDVNPGVVAATLKDGRAELSEDHVQRSLEEILEVSFHRKDWGGETNDLYTSYLKVNGARTATAFALKGNGCKARELRIADCGRNGDQLVRLLESPADLFVVQYIGPISDAVIKDLAGKVDERRAQGKRAWFCVLDGQDTARLLMAYGRLP